MKIQSMEQFNIGAKVCAEYIRAAGWEPLITVAVKHGRAFSFHCYVAKVEPGTIARFEFFSDPHGEKIADDPQIKVFPSADVGNADYKTTTFMASVCEAYDVIRYA